jgi:hypothetical protein
MGIFSSKPYDPNKDILKRDLSKAEYKAIMAEAKKEARKGRLRGAIKSGTISLVNKSTGKINELGPFQKVAKTRERIKKKQCPSCGKGVTRKGYFCAKCSVAEAAEFTTTASDMQEQHTLYTPDGRNKNNIRWDEPGYKFGNND